MTDRRFDVLALGNAIVDILAAVEEDALIAEGMPKGSMTLIDEARAEAVFSRLVGAARISGGSAANTVAGLASLGGKAAFIGKVKDDALGRSFRRDIKAAGVHFETAPNQDGPATARCMVLVTPDGERTMGTFLGASSDLTPADVDKSLVEQAKIVYLEGYLWDPPQAKNAFLTASKYAHAAGARVALSLSDSFCVDRYRDEFRQLIETQQIDILFANQHEVKSLYETADLGAALEAVRAAGLVAAITRSEDGCSIFAEGRNWDVPACRIDRLVDATGAGDLFAAGFLHGLANDRDYETCGRLGALAASEVIGHFGARPERDLAALARGAGLMS